MTGIDAGGIRRLGWVATRLSDGSVIRRDSTAPDLTGTQSDVARNFGLDLPDTLRFPSQVVLQAFAVDSVGNRGASVSETLTVVAGRTFSLPTGSLIADAIYNRNRRELYLSNFAFDRIEVFSLASNSFVASIPVGSRPWGIALWPRDTLGVSADTIIVANSGGTNFSIVDMVGRREVRRHRLPNYHIQKVKTSTNQTTGAINVEITDYEFSDRPQYVGAVCRVSGSASCSRVIAVYSTTPTGAQSFELPNRGYIAWENLTPGATPEGHFFWEPAVGAGSRLTDTLQVISVRDTAPGLVQEDTLLGAGQGVMVSFVELVYQDTTFVRNSGNFRRAVVGEGGLDEGFARVLAYDVSAGIDTSTVCPGTGSLLALILNCRRITDRGVSPSTYVSDFLVNRAASVTGIATNFNGRTSLVRADSIYVFDWTLRQTGLLQVSGQATGMDLAPGHAFLATLQGTDTLPGNGDADARIVFAARPDSSIDVFDTYFFGRVNDTTRSAVPIPIRNALIGAVRVAQDTTGGTQQTVLFGITARGLVLVRLPSFTNPFPVRRPPALSTGLPAVRGVRATRGTSPPDD